MRRLREFRDELINSPIVTNIKAGVKSLKKSIKNGPIEKVSLNKEEAPTNVAGGSQIAGIGVGPSGEPGVMKKRKILRRFREVTNKNKQETT